MPLVGAAAVQFEHEDIVVDVVAVGVQGRDGIRIPGQGAVPGQVEVIFGVDVQGDNISAVAVEGMPLVSAVRIQLHGEGVGRLGGEGVQRSCIPIAQPGGAAGTGHVDLAGGAHGDLACHDGVQIAAVEGVPLVGAVRIQLDHRQIIAAAAEGVQRGGAALAQPGVVALAAYVDIPGRVHIQTGPQVLVAGGEEGMPLIGAAAVQLEHHQGGLPRSGMRVQGWGITVAQPIGFAVAGNIEIAAGVAGETDQVIIQAGTVEGVPLVSAVRVQPGCQDIRAAAVGVQGICISIAQPATAAAADVDIAGGGGLQARGFIGEGSVPLVAVEGVPLVGAGRIQLEHRQILPAAVSVQWGRIAIPQPGQGGRSDGVHAAASGDYTIGSLQGGVARFYAVEGVPLVGAGGIQLEHSEVTAAAVGVQRGCIAIAQPALPADRRHVDVAGGVCGAAVRPFVGAIGSIEGMPLVSAGAAQLEHGEININPTAVGVQRGGVASAVPGIVAHGLHIQVSGAVQGGAIGRIHTTAAVEGVPLVGAGGVQLQGDDVTAAAVGVQRGCIAISQPGSIAVAGQGDAPIGCHGERRAVILSCRAIEGVPLVGAAAIQLEHGHIPCSAVGVQRGRIAISQPIGARHGADIHVAGGVQVNIPGGIMHWRAIEGVPLVGAVCVQFEHGHLPPTAVGVQRLSAAIPQPGRLAVAGHVDITVGVHADIAGDIDARAVEGVPLVGAVCVQLDDRQVIDACALGVQRRRSVIPQPVAGLAQDVDISAGVGVYG